MCVRERVTGTCVIDYIGSFLDVSNYLENLAFKIKKLKMFIFLSHVSNIYVLTFSRLSSHLVLNVYMHIEFLNDIKG